MPDPEFKKNLQDSAKEKSRNFVLAYKGKDIKLFLSKKKIQLPKAKGVRTQIGEGAKAVTGVVQKSIDGMTYKSTEKFPQVGKTLKKPITDETGLTVAPSLVNIDSVARPGTSHLAARSFGSNKSRACLA